MADGALSASAYRVFGSAIRADGRHARRLHDLLPAANMNVLPQEYLSLALATTLIVGLAAAVLFAPLLWVLELDLVLLAVAIVGVSLLCAVLTYATFLAVPFLVASERGANIDDNLPFALQYMSATSGPGVTLDGMLERAGRQEIYGQVSIEMARMRRDMVLLGLERTAAIERAIQRCPSERLKEVLQGLSSTLSAGGSVPAYLEAKAEELLKGHVARQRSALENLGLLSEVFIVIAVAIPLLLVILLVALALYGTAPDRVIGMGFALFAILVPALYAAFIGAMAIYKPPS